MSEYRHVCFKDLDNYFKISDYFGNLSEVEKQLIRTNLNVGQSENTITTEIIEGTYLEIKYLLDNDLLVIYNKYIITDFQSIYYSNTNETWGIPSKNPSQTYQILLTPTSSNSFDSRVILFKDGIPLNWEVYYDIKRQTLPDGVYTKGRITYLKDQNNNSAYYDFKNYKFQIELDTEIVSDLSYPRTIIAPTFSSFTNGKWADCSDDESICNNQLTADCYGNVFMGLTCNNYFAPGFKNNVFVKNCTYNNFDYNNYNNLYTVDAYGLSGSVKNAVIQYEDESNQYINKQLKMIPDASLILTYVDDNNLITQIVKLQNKHENFTKY